MGVEQGGLGGGRGDQGKDANDVTWGLESSSLFLAPHLTIVDNASRTDRKAGRC